MLSESIVFQKKMIQKFENLEKNLIEKHTRNVFEKYMEKNSKKEPKELQNEPKGSSQKVLFLMFWRV